MNQIDPRARAYRKGRKRLTDDEKIAELERDQAHARGEIVDIGFGASWRQPIRSDDT